jgi:hypothetical protein
MPLNPVGGGDAKTSALAAADPGGPGRPATGGVGARGEFKIGQLEKAKIIKRSHAMKVLKRSK